MNTITLYVLQAWGYNLLHILDTDGRTSGCRKVQLTPAEMFCRNIIGDSIASATRRKSH